MDILLGLLLTVGVFLLVVLVHEFGHFFVARKVGMKVDEFGFGIPPKVKTLFRDQQGTEYTFNLLPIGGFVRIHGEDAVLPDPKDPHGFISKKWYQRIAVLLAGVVMNFLLAWIIFSGLFYFGTSPITVIPFDSGKTHSFFLPSLEEGIESGFVTHNGIVLTPLTGSVADRSGIQANDQLISIDGQIFSSPDDVIKKIREGKSVKFELNRSGSVLAISVTPENSRIGATVAYKDLKLHTEKKQKFSLTQSLIRGSEETYYSSLLTLSFLSKIIDGIIVPDTPEQHEEAKEMLSGPIGVGMTFIGLMEMSAPISLILVIIALLSINLGVVNILPFPALDGGRVVSTTLYSIFTFFRFSRDTFFLFEKYFHSLGFIVLLVFMLYVAGIDISRFF